MANNPRALVARVVEALRGDLVPYAPATKRVPVTAADYIEGGARLPLVYTCDVTTKGRDTTGMTGTLTATDATQRGRTVQINRMAMDEWALIPDDAVVRVTLEVLR